MNKISIASALAKGIAAANSGKTTQADQFFTAILEKAPDHAQANHNLGMLGVSLGKSEKAIPFLRRALEADQSNPKFWLSTISTLIALKRWQQAKELIDRARHNGIIESDIKTLESQLQNGSDVIFANGNQDTLANHVTELVAQYKNGELEMVLEGATRLLMEVPKSARLHNLRGAALAGLSRFNEAIESYEVSLSLKPRSAQSLNNLGVAKVGLGDLEGAILSYKKAINLDQKYAAPLANIGSIYKTMGNHERAFKFLTAALKIDPHFAEANTNLGNLLVEKQRYCDAINHYKVALIASPNSFEILYNLGVALQEGSFKDSDQMLETQILQLLNTQSCVSPSSVCRPILSLLRHNIAIRDGVLNEAEADVELLTTKLDKLATAPLFLELISLCPITDRDFEKGLTKLRNLILLNIDKLQASDSLLKVQAALAMQCYNNEYIFAVTNKEHYAVKQLERSVSEKILHGTAPNFLEVLCLGSYNTLNRYKWALELKFDRLTKRVERQQILEPKEEKSIKINLSKLRQIKNHVSSEVRTQYEEHPYPKWQQTRIQFKPISIAGLCTEINLKLNNEDIKICQNPNILIAGSGTGRHAVETSTRFENSRVLAIDLSLSSLAYAQRKTKELSIDNITYMQADILDLHKLNKNYDMIECSGVLHHMEDPLQGWRALVSCLKPGGLLKIGLYSSLARGHITMTKAEIFREKIKPNRAAIKKFRNDVLNSSETHHAIVSSSPDFYSTSSLRDLLFHAQEHCFSLPQIKKYIKKLDLTFCGFENQKIVKRFRNLHTKSEDATNLDLWDLYENENPTAFEGMYQFWCQKL